MTTARSDTYSIPLGANLIAGDAGEVALVPALRFNVAANSQFLALLRALGVLCNG